MYRTGDLGCFLADGQISFRGRVDNQEQIHGHRVETDEIVCALNRHPAIAASAVIARGNACAKSLVRTWCRAKPKRPRRPICASFFRQLCRNTWFPRPTFEFPLCPPTRTVNWIAARFPIRMRRTALRTPVIAHTSTPTEERLVQILAPLLGVTG